MQLEPDLEICRQVLAQSRLAHFHIPNWARRLLPEAKRLGLTISCDIQDVVDLADPYRQDFIDGADILFFSAANHSDPVTLVEALFRKNPQQVIVVGMGAAGCALGIEGRIQYFPPVNLDTPIIDTNGAGDGLAVGFLSSYVLDNFSPEDAILRGQICARFTCSRKASSANLIRSEHLEDIFGRLVR
jgi:sugar/nucleoside kinase (ribokinase family)